MGRGVAPKEFETAPQRARMSRGGGDVLDRLTGGPLLAPAPATANVSHGPRGSIAGGPRRRSCGTGSWFWRGTMTPSSGRTSSSRSSLSRRGGGGDGFVSLSFPGALMWIRSTAKIPLRHKNFIDVVAFKDLKLFISHSLPLFPHPFPPVPGRY